MLIVAQKHKVQWLISLVCDDLSHASGACHRSLQLVHILEANGWELFNISPPPPVQRLKTLLFGVIAFLRSGPLFPLGIESLRSQGHCAYLIHSISLRFPNLKGLIQEGTGYGSLFLVAECRRRGLQSILVPANIESLAPNFESWTHRNSDVSARFSFERRWWSMADAVFTISLEEAWWLQLHGISAEWLPYYPPPRRLQELATIRQARQPAHSNTWLWLADFRNPANKHGAHLTLSWLQSCTSPPDKLFVVGRGCSWLKEHHGHRLPSYARLYGEISDNKLNLLYRSCSAQLIIHPATSGMLTRVVDAALAGIPIVANTMALKSYSMCFTTSSTGLLSVMQKPDPPVNSINVFLDALVS